MEFESTPKTGALAGLKLVMVDEAGGSNAASDPEYVAKRTQELVDTGMVVGWVGGVDSDALAVELPRLNAAGVSTVSPGATATPFNRRDRGFPGAPIKYYPAFNKYGLNFARIAPTDQTLADHCLGDLASQGVKRVFTVDTGDTDGDSFSSAVETRAPLKGVSLVGHESLPDGNADWQGLVQQLAAVKAQAVVWGSASGSGDAELWRAVSDAKLSVRMVGGPAMPPSGLKSLAKLMPGSSICAAAVPASVQTSASGDLAGKFRARWGHEPTPGALRGAAAMALMLDALQRSTAAPLAAPLPEASRQSVATGLARTRRIDSLMGVIELDQLGNWRTAPLGMWSVASGQLKFRQLK